MKICEAGLQKLRRHSYQNIVVPGYNGSFVGAQHVVPWTKKIKKVYLPLSLTAVDSRVRGNDE